MNDCDSFTEWRDWAPGVLSARQVKQLCGALWITGPTKPAQFDLSSMDLTVGAEMWEMPQGAVKPRRKSRDDNADFIDWLKERRLVVLESERLQERRTLERRTTYLVALRERLEDRVALWDADIHGQATAKSSIGRLDVLARLVVDGATEYEGFTPECLRYSSGSLYLEVTPLTFDIELAEGDSLSQLRLFKGAPETSRLRDESISARVLSGTTDHSLSVSLDPDSELEGNPSAFVAEGSNGRVVVDLGKKGKQGVDPTTAWDLQKANRKPESDDGKNRERDDGELFLKIEQNRFYILRSVERITLPSDIAVYCRAIDEAIGEMRIHYAGFVHPRFGIDGKDSQKAWGTPLIFEVRGHDVPVTLRHGERLARLEFYRMSEPCAAGSGSEYSDQELKLSKHFADWPKEQSNDQSDEVE